jgi:hypothetical protein
MERLMKSKLPAWLLLALPMLLLNARAADKITLEKIDSHEIHALNERANQSMQRFYAEEGYQQVEGKRSSGAVARVGRITESVNRTETES